MSERDDRGDRGTDEIDDGADGIDDGTDEIDDGADGSVTDDLDPIDPSSEIVRPGEARGEPDVRPDLPLTPWQLATITGTLGWYVIIAASFVDSLVPFVVVLFLVCWPLLPIAMYFDMRSIAEYTKWPRRRWIYLTVAFLWVFAAVAGTLYLWNRRRISEAGPR